MQHLSLQKELKVKKKIRKQCAFPSKEEEGPDANAKLIFANSASILSSIKNNNVHYH